MKIFRKLLAAVRKKFFRRRTVKKRKTKARRAYRLSSRRKKSSRRNFFRFKRKGKKPKLKKPKKAKASLRAKNPQKPKTPPRVFKKKPEKQIPNGEFIGDITHYFSKIKVCVIHLTHGSLAVGDRLEIKGRTTRFTQKVLSLQIENENVASGQKGQMVGLKVDKKCRVGDKAFKIEP